MPYFQQLGEVPRRRHTQFRQPDGRLYYEELAGEEGFSGDSSLLYHMHSPGRVASADTLEVAPVETFPNYPLLPRHLKPHCLEVGGNMVTGRVSLLVNSDVTVAYSASHEPSPLYRNVGGDELVFVESGSATVETVYGALVVEKGDYVVIPTATTHRWVPRGDEALRTLIYETSGHVSAPERYLSDKGQFLESAPYCELDLRTPEEPLLVDGSWVEVLYKQKAGFTRYVMERHPFDVVGWFGCMYPYAFNIWDFSPLTGSLHRPPPVHQTFTGPNIVICSFVPRIFDYHPDSVPVPPFHANVDSDEVLFYAAGDFMSRKGSGIEQGSISVHPGGYIHGPHPGSVEAALGAERTDETAVMLDTFAPLHLSSQAFDVEEAEYIKTWLPAGH